MLRRLVPSVLYRNFVCDFVPRRNFRRPAFVDCQLGRSTPPSGYFLYSSECVGEATHMQLDKKQRQDIDDCEMTLEGVFDRTTRNHDE